VSFGTCRITYTTYKLHECLIDTLTPHERYNTDDEGAECTHDFKSRVIHVLNNPI